MKKEMFYIGADHAGFEMKEKIKEFLRKNKIIYEDVSLKIKEGDDYPFVSFKLGELVAKSNKSRGILVCGSGEGVVIAANKVKGIRAVSPYDIYTAKMSRLDNNSNVIGLSSRNMSFSKIKMILKKWIETDFSNEVRHKRRINEIIRYEK